MFISITVHLQTVKLNQLFFLGKITSFINKNLLFTRNNVQSSLNLKYNAAVCENQNELFY